MSVDKHASLITRLSACTGVDRALADEVLLACGWRKNYWYESGDIWSWRKSDGTDLDRGDEPNPLANLQDAANLIPDDDWEWELTWLDGKACAKLGDPLRFPECEASTPAIALVIACLRAREAGVT